MKKAIKLFAASLVILASHSFAQTSTTNGEKVTTNIGTASAVKGGKISEVGSYVFPQQTSQPTFLQQERRNLKSQGLNNREIHRMIHRDELKMKADRRAERREQRHREVANSNGRSRTTQRLLNNHDKMVKNGVTPAQVMHRAAMKQSK